MSHEIFGNNFISLRQPAWHRLGMVIEDEIGAVEAGNRLSLPILSTESLHTKEGLSTNHKAILGELNGEKRVYTVVSGNYHEVSHQSILEVMDEVVQKPIETIGLLYKGEGMFLTVRCPTFSVKGDEVASYLMVENWLDRFRKVRCRKTPVRVVCMNTLQASDNSFVSEMGVSHHREVVPQLKVILKEMIDHATMEYETVKEAFDILAGYRVSDEVVKESIFKEVYADIPKPVVLSSGVEVSDENLKELAAWERANGSQIKHREHCFELFSGKGAGSMTDAAKGTTWGAWNAIVEYEQYLKKFKRSESFMFGVGADRVNKAYEVCLELVK